MTLADDLHLCGRCGHAVIAALHHRFKQFPRVVALQFEQGFVNGKHRKFRVVARAIVVAAGDLYLHH